MNCKCLFIILCALLIFNEPTSAQLFSLQSNRILDAGIVGGPNYSNITSADKIIISEPYFINGKGYTLDNKWITGFRFGAFLNYSFHLSDEDDKNSNWFVYAEVAYSGEGTRLKFNNDSMYNYTIDFHYQYANFLALFGGRTGGLSIAIGPELGLNASPRNIDFTSSGAGRRDAFGTDLSQEQQLRNALSGQNNFGLVGAVGYQIFPFADIEVRYHYGFKDIIQVQPNNYNWTQQTNHDNNVQLLLKIYFTHRERIRDPYY